MWLGLRVPFEEVSAYGRLKMQCFYVAGAMTECLLRRGAFLREARLQIQRLYVAGT